ncbi:hypothetical protein [Pseudonocardia spinosispora]|uniref:hypothetical protein n=1 Tax=Pseudonocardia spinosispora TaxID=103441 RepID=UPI000414561C|nr:hypothetical protein [Pseudonocardia spinosispora]
MNRHRVLTYIAATTTAVCTAGAFSATAWASTPSADAGRAAAKTVTAKQCHADKGKVIKTGKTFTCKGGTSDRKSVSG